MPSKKSKSTKSKKQNPNTQIETGLLVVLIIVLMVILTHAFIKYKKAHTYIVNPNPAAHEQ